MATQNHDTLAHRKAPTKQGSKWYIGYAGDEKEIIKADGEILVKRVPVKVQLPMCTQKKITSFHKDEKRQDIVVWINRQNTEAFNCPDGRPVQKLDMRKRYRIVGGHYRQEHQEQKWSLIAGGDEDE